MNLKDKTVVIDNKMYRYSKIAMLPTKDKLNNLKGYKDASLLFAFKTNYLNNEENIEKELSHFHLYFLSSDKICEGDWCIDPTFGVGKIIISNGEECYYSPHESGGSVTTPWKKNLENRLNKIIASTNPEYNLPKPSNSFLQVYIDAYNKNEKIEECLVEYEEYGEELGCDPAYYGLPSHRPKTTKGEITIRKVKDSWSREEVITKLRDAYLDIVEGGYSKGLNQWISENL